MTDEGAPTAPPEEPTTATEARLALERKGLAVIKGTAEFEAMQTRLIEARLERTDAYEAYLYVILPTPENRLTKPIIGPTLDFKKLMVQMLNATGRARLTMLKEQPPIIEDVALDGGRRLVRAMVCVIDEMTGIVKWAVKEETRRSAHAATIAVEKAEGKAYESHPVFNRKLVAAEIKKWLKKVKLDPKGFTISGGTGPWGDFFQRASKAGVKPDELRDTVRSATGGAGFSGMQTAEQVKAAAAAVDESAKGSSAAAPGPPAAAPPTGPEGEPARASRRAGGGRASRTAASGTPASIEASPPVGPAPEQVEQQFDQVEIPKLRNETLERFAKKGVSDEVIKTLWQELGPGEGKQARIIHYRRMHRVAVLVGKGAPLDAAIQFAKSMYPEARKDAEETF